MNNITMQGYKRISKAQAIKLFADDVTIRIVPRKLMPNNDWDKIDFSRKQWESENMELGQRVLADWCFNNFCIRWTYYSGNYEAGYYPAFYVKA